MKIFKKEEGKLYKEEKRPLDFAISLKKEEIYDLLISKGADHNETNN